MAAVIEDGGFRVIRTDGIEYALKTGRVSICGRCGRPGSHGGQGRDGCYVAALDRWLCLRCYGEWAAGAELRPEERAEEERNFEIQGGRLL